MFAVTDCEALGEDQTSSEASCIDSVDEMHKIVISADMVGTFVEESSMAVELSTDRVEVLLLQHDSRV